MNKSRIRALVATAYSDGFFDSRELHVINTKAKDLGLSGEEILEIIRNPENESILLPVTVEEKIQFMYDLMRVILADGKIEDNEKEIFYKYLKELDFNFSWFDDLFNTMVESVKNNDSVDTYRLNHFDDEI